MQRTKGATYEREVCHALSTATGVAVQRNIGQARDGGNDIDFGPLRIECKRRKSLTTMETWMAQAEAATDRREGQTPVVIGREDNGESVIIWRLSDFLALFADELAQLVDADVEPRELRFDDEGRPFYPVTTEYEEDED